MSFKFLLISLFAINFAFAEDGPGTSGGGGAFVCTNADGAIASSELVDLWEARNLDNLNIVNSDQEYWQQAEAALNRFVTILPSLGKEMIEQLHDIKTRVYFVPNNVGLAPPSDVNHGYQKPGCPLAGMMYYDSKRQRLSIDQRVFDALISNTDKAAALTHEAIYNIMRAHPANPQKSSENARKIVGCIFSSDVAACLGVKSTESQIPVDGNLFQCRINEIDTEFLVHVGELTPSNTSNYLDWKRSVFLTKFLGDPIAVATVSTSIFSQNTDGSGTGHDKWNVNQGWFSGLDQFGITYLRSSKYQRRVLDPQNSMLESDFIPLSSFEGVRSKFVSSLANADSNEHAFISVLKDGVPNRRSYKTTCTQLR